MVDSVAHGVSQGHEEPIVRHSGKLESSAHMKIEAIANEDERNVIHGVRVALTQFVSPDNQGVVKKASGAARLGGFGQTAGEIGHLLAEPTIDPGQLVLSCLVVVGSVRQLMVAFVDLEPAHPRLTD